MKDTVYRQDTIDALVNHFKRIPTTAIRAKHVIEKLPSANHTGKWIGNYTPYVCDQCGKHSDSKTNFCWNCGADMKDNGNEDWLDVQATLDAEADLRGEQE